MTHPNTFGSRATLECRGAAVHDLPPRHRCHRSSGSTVTTALQPEDSPREPAAQRRRRVREASRHRGARTWDVKAQVEKEIAFRTSRVLLQDFTGVPGVVDLAAMRDAMRAARRRSDSASIRCSPSTSSSTTRCRSTNTAREAAFLINTELEFERNRSATSFLRWGQNAFENFRVVPPGTGICHQVNLEYLGESVFTRGRDGETVAYPDSLVGTDSHTTMINGLGVLGWGVGGIEAEAAMLGQPVSMLIPEVVGFKLHGKLPPGATATDLVLTVTEMLRKKKVVGKFVEFYGSGLSTLPLADRATIANMAPEYGATMGFFPVDAETLKYLRLTGRGGDHAALVEAYARSRDFSARTTCRTRCSPTRSSSISRRSSRASRDRSVRRIASRSRKSKPMFRDALKADLERLAATGAGAQPERGDGGLGDARARASAVALAPQKRRRRRRCRGRDERQTFTLRHGAVVIAAITSCTNTSNPSVMLAAGLLARNAVAKGLKTKPWVKTSCAPGSKVVTDYYEAAGVHGASREARLPHRRLRLHDVHRQLADRCPSRSRRRSRRTSWWSRPCCRATATSRAASIRSRASTISRRRRSSSRTRSPGAWTSTSTREPIGVGKDGPVFLRDIWPAPAEVEDEIMRSREGGACSSGSTRTSSRATTSGARSTCRRAICTRGTTTRRT